MFDWVHGRWPDGDRAPVRPPFQREDRVVFFDSEAFGKRYRYGISLPPGYGQPENADTRYPLIITLISVGLVRLPLGYLLGITLGWGLVGAWGAMCIDMVVRGTLAACRFRRGKWLTARV